MQESEEHRMSRTRPFGEGVASRGCGGENDLTLGRGHDGSEANRRMKCTDRILQSRYLSGRCQRVCKPRAGRRDRVG